jgi:hypothetical protein
MLELNIVPEFSSPPGNGMSVDPSDNKCSWSWTCSFDTIRELHANRIWYTCFDWSWVFYLHLSTGSISLNNFCEEHNG